MTDVTILPERIVFSGILEKQGGKVKSWKQRYCFIHEHVLYYSKDQKSFQNFKGQIKLIDCVLTVEHNKYPNQKAPAFCFSLRIPEGSDAKRLEYLFKADKAENRDVWMDQIRRNTTFTVFGSTLQNSLMFNPHQNGLPLPVPHFISQAFLFIETKSICKPDLYNAPYATANLDAIKADLNLNRNVDFNTVEMNAVPAVVRAYLRELKEPIFPTSFYPELRSIAFMRDEEVPKALSELMKRIPIPNYIFAHYLFRHFLILLGSQLQNNFRQETVFSILDRSLLRVDSSETRSDAETDTRNKIALHILVHYNKIFGSHPFLFYRPANESIYAVVAHRIVNSPYILEGKVGDVCQIISYDPDGWAIAVCNHSWGAIHRSYLTLPDTFGTIFRSLDTQNNKWSLSDEFLKSVFEKSPEAKQLYNYLCERYHKLRN